MGVHKIDLKGFFRLAFQVTNKLASRLSQGKTCHIFGDGLLSLYGSMHIFCQWEALPLK